MKSCTFLTAASLLLVSVSPIWATSSGLNNTPIGDTTGQGIMAIQTLNAVGEGHDDFNPGFRTDLDFDLIDCEIRVDSCISTEHSGSVTFYAKIADPLGNGLPIFALGIANITFSGEEAKSASEIFGHFLESKDFRFIRAHIGYGFQDNSLFPFIGLGKMETTASLGLDYGKNDRGSLTSRADMIQQQNSGWPYSAGLLSLISKHVAFET